DRRYAFELRDRELLTTRYVEVLRAHGAAHAISFWQSMPSVGEQLDFLGPVEKMGPFAAIRLVQPPGGDYKSRSAECAPFDRVVFAEERMRDDVARAIRACVAAGVELVISVDNKAEGSAPLTVRALAERAARELAR